jgi:hypothetical protein
MATSSFKRRLAKIEGAVGRLVGKNPTRSLQGCTHDAIWDAVEAAIDPADQDVVERIAAHVRELAAVPWQNQTTKEKYLDEDGKVQPTPHFFIFWLWGLEAGSWNLPKRIPRAVLEGFDSRWGAVLHRCEDCRTGLGNGHGPFSTCPVCGGGQLSCKKLSGPPWDKHWQYTPLPMR